MIPQSKTMLSWQNGYSFGRHTHYLATQKTSSVVQKVWHDLQDANIKSIHGFIQGKKAASKTFELDETDTILKLHYLVSKKLHALKLQEEQSESDRKAVRRAGHQKG